MGCVVELNELSIRIDDQNAVRGLAEEGVIKQLYFSTYFIRWFMAAFPWFFWFFFIVHTRTKVWSPVYRK